MKEINVRYEWSWRCLSLFRNFDHEPIDIGGVRAIGGGSSRVFTLHPKWVWFYWKAWGLYCLGVWPHPNMYIHFERFEKKWKRTHPDDDFSTILKRYAASCEPGFYVKLQPMFLK